MNTVKVKLQAVDNGGMDRLSTSETIHIPTGGEAERFQIIPGSSQGIRSPSIVLIDKSPSPGRGKLNKYQEVPKIPTRSRIPVPHRSTRTSIYGQPLSASSRRSNTSNQTTPSVSFPTDRATYENLLGQMSTSRNLPVLPAIGVSASQQPGGHNQAVSPGPATGNNAGQADGNQGNSLPYSGVLPARKHYYHVTNIKPVFQMKAEYNNMLQKYASNIERHQDTLAAKNHGHNHSPRIPCKGCGGRVQQAHSRQGHTPQGHAHQGHGHNGHQGQQTQGQQEQSGQGQQTLPSPAMEQSYVQQWLVDPSHPYQFPPQSLASTEEAKQPVATVPLVFSTPTDHNRKQPPTKPADVPIRYTQAPTQQIISKSSGKLLSPEDALKRQLKRKKIPPLTKRNSLRSIFSDASSNLQKIEEMEEDRDSDGQSRRGQSRGQSRGKSRVQSRGQLRAKGARSGASPRSNSQVRGSLLSSEA